MAFHDAVLWEVDVQADFMLPGGKLYVPGAEKLLGNIRKLTDVARKNQAFLVSHGCFHTPTDPEFKTFPPHCVKGTPGANFVAEALADKFVTVPNEESAALPDDLSQFQQIILEKQTLNVFETWHADALVRRLGNPEFLVFGVVTEFCVACAARGLLERGRRVSLVQDAIETLKSEESEKTLAELQSMGASLITTEQVLALIASA
jgi:nicotinamidase/pyrazinamidase